MEPEEEEHLIVPMDIDEGFLWGCWSGPDEAKIYINETDTLTFSGGTMLALLKVFRKLFVERLEEKPDGKLQKPATAA